MVPVTFHGGPLDGVTVEAAGLVDGSRYTLDGHSYTHAVVDEVQLLVRPADVDDVEVRPADQAAAQVRPARAPRRPRGSAGA